MTDIIDQIARAMFDATPFKETAGPYEDQSGTYQRMCRLLARAAYDVVREEIIECLEADLNSAVEVAWKRGAKDWVKLNYPKHYERFTGEKP
jgi:hypothetical protein